MADLSITAANVIKTASNVETGTAYVALTAGQVLYKRSADQKLALAQADGTVEEATVAGIALHAAAANQPISYAVSGTLNIGATTAKTFYYLSATAGGLAPFADLTSGQRIVQVGYATATDGSFVISKVVTGAAVT
jgi:hypothetical protein